MSAYLTCYLKCLNVYTCMVQNIKFDSSKRTLVLGIDYPNNTLALSAISHFVASASVFFTYKFALIGTSISAESLHPSLAHLQRVVFRSLVHPSDGGAA